MTTPTPVLTDTDLSILLRERTVPLSPDDVDAILAGRLTVAEVMARQPVPFEDVDDGRIDTIWMDDWDTPIYESCPECGSNGFPRHGDACLGCMDDGEHDVYDDQAG